VCKISAQYIHFYLGFYASQKNNISADVYVHLAVNGLINNNIENSEKNTSEVRITAARFNFRGRESSRGDLNFQRT
jgi:tRNA U34 5-methylaminomethyl-2-thiouridine-forming methyltransferase MnmC